MEWVRNKEVGRVHPIREVKQIFKFIGHMKIKKP